MRRRVMMGTKEKLTSKERSSIVVCDILCSAQDGTKYVYDKTEYDNIPSSLTPIGIVVIPPSHNVYGNGKGAAIALTDVKSFYLGLTRLIDDFDVPTLQQETYPYDTYSSTSYMSDWSLPNDYVKLEYPDEVTQCAHDPGKYYRNTYRNHFIPSPYLSGTSKNPDYCKYLLSYFNGKELTSKMIGMATAQSDWKTASSLTDNYTTGYYPAACSCWRYSSVGTKQGDWYLPSLAELCYACCNGAKISEIGAKFGKTILSSIRTHTVNGIYCAYVNGSFGQSYGAGISAKVTMFYQF